MLFVHKKISLRILVAMAYDIKSLEDTTDADIEKVMRSAGYGTFYCMQACFPYLKKHGGKIINFGSMAGLYGLKDTLLILLSKKGLSAWREQLP